MSAASHQHISQVNPAPQRFISIKSGGRGSINSVRSFQSSKIGKDHDSVSFKSCNEGGVPAGDFESARDDEQSADGTSEYESEL